MTTKVSIVACEDYSSAKEPIRNSLELIGGLENIIINNDRVLIKANVLAAKPSENAVTTHPAIVKAVIELVQEIGGIPFVG